MNDDIKKPRPYRRIDKRTVAIFNAAKLDIGNNTATARNLNPEYKSPESRGYHIAKKSKEINAAEYIDTALEQMAEPAMRRISEMVNSTDERIATKNAQYVTDHIRGKAVQRSISLTAKMNIQSVLD